MSTSIHHTATRTAAAHPALGFIAAFRDMVAVARQRKALADLPDHLLSAIGVSADAAKQEAERAPWDVPAYWRG